MSRTAFDEIALEGERQFDAHPIAPRAARITGRVRRRRAARAVVVGGATVAACTAIAFAATATREANTPSATNGEVLDPATIHTSAGLGGTNLVGTCPGDNFSETRPEAELKNNQFEILTGVADCELASVSGADMISAQTTLTKQVIDKTTSIWVRTTLTNVSDQTLAFDLASPTLEITVPETYWWKYELMTAERPLHADESWMDHPGIESWGGSTAPRGGVGGTTTPVLDGPPAPGVAWNLVLQRASDHGYTVSTSRGTVTLNPGESFVFESVLSPEVPVGDERPTPPYTDLFADPSQLEIAAYLALQPDTRGGSDRTLLVDAQVPATWAR